LQKQNSIHTMLSNESWLYSDITFPVMLFWVFETSLIIVTGLLESVKFCSEWI